jgi:PPOX class probable F420-dependent enzyme
VVRSADREPPSRPLARLGAVWEIARVRKGLTPEELGDLLELPLVSVLATYRRDGSVLLSPVWHEWRDGGFNVQVYAGDVKAGHLRRDPRASIVVCDDGPPYRGLELRTDARLGDEEGHAMLLRIATRYLGPEAGRRYADAAGEADILVVRLEPGALRTWDFADEPLLARSEPSPMSTE